MTKLNSFWQPVKKQKLKPAPLFGFNLKPQKVKSISPVNLKIYPARTKREMKLIDKNPFGDKDKDKVPNFWDCRPLNRKKQGFLVRVTKKGVKERYKPQVQKIVDKMTTAHELADERAVEIINKWKGDTQLRKLKQLDMERQTENVGFYDFTSIPGVKNVEYIKAIYDKKTPMSLIVEKGIVKGEIAIKQRSPEVVEVKSVYILPEYRKKGLGKKVITSIFKNPNIKKIVGVATAKSKEYWEKQGGMQGSSIEEKEALEEHRKGVLRTAGIPENIPQESLNPLMQNVIKTSGYSFELTKKEFKKRYPEESKPGLFSDKRAKASIWKRGLHVDDDSEDELELKRKTKERYFRGIADEDEEEDKKREKSKVTSKTIEEINKWRKSREEPIIKKIRIRQTKEEKEDAAKLADWYEKTYGPKGKFRKGEEQLMKSYEKSDEKGDEDNIRMEDIQFEDENLEEEVDSSKIKKSLKSIPSPKLELAPEKMKEEKPISEEQQRRRDRIRQMLGRDKWGTKGSIVPSGGKKENVLSKLKDIKETPKKIQSIIPGEFEQELYYKIPQIPLIKVQEEDRRLTEAKSKYDKIVSDKEKKYEEQLLKEKEDYEGSAQQLLDLSDTTTSKEFKETAYKEAPEPKEKAERTEREPTAQQLIDESI